MGKGTSTQDSTTQQTQNQTQNSTTNPWANAQPALTGILGQLQGGLNNTGLTGAENSAYGTLQSNANNYGSTYAPQIGNYASTLLNGGGANAQAGNVSQGYQDYGSSLGGLNGAASNNLAGYQSALTGANSGAQSNLDAYRSQLTPYANGSMVGNNPALQAQLSQIGTDVTNQVNGSFAAAGRDFSGSNQMALGRGIAAGEAPVIANQYNQDVGNQLNAAGSLYGAGNTTGQFQANNAGSAFGAGQSTGQFQAGNAGNLYGAGNTNAGILSGLQQQSLANQGQGVQASQDALSAQNSGANAALQAEAARRGIPVQALGLLAQIGIPIAGLGGTSSGTSNGTSNGTQNTVGQMSGADQFGKIASGTGNLLGGLGKLGSFF